MEFATGAGGTEDIFDGRSSKRARSTLPSALHAIAIRKLDLLNAAESLADLKAVAGNGLHAMIGDRAGQFAIKINAQYRVCFRWTDDGPTEVEITDYH